MFRASILQAERPRDVNAWQAASILYGDWGTSKAYVVGLAFALAGYSSFWLILGVSLLNILVGLNYMIICKCYPYGGGVYASVRHRSEVLALIGGFFLIGDYIVTASLSALSAFSYLGVDHPQIWAAGIIGFIGALNYFGPRHTGNLAFLLTISAVLVVLTLGALAIPHLDMAVKIVEPPHGGFTTTWVAFVGTVVALSGVEAVANTTGVMRLDSGSTISQPSVVKTSTPAILAVMLEVSFFTALFSLAINALPGLVRHGTEVSAPGYPNVRDAMLRYMGEIFLGNYAGADMGAIFGMVISIVFGLLLLSAVNTAIIALSSLLFILSHDGQLPKMFMKLNRFGVPVASLWLSTIAPIAVLFFVHNMTALANLYAVGFVGAIATNLGSTSTDSTLMLSKRERILMFATFILMAAIEVTLFVEKSHARHFVIFIVAVGLLLRSLVMEQKDKKLQQRKTAKSISLADSTKQALAVEVPEMPQLKPIEATPRIYQKKADDRRLHYGPILCAVTHIGKSLEFALRESVKRQEHLYILFIREQKIIAPSNFIHDWLEDELAKEIYEFINGEIDESGFTFLYEVSESPAHTIIQHAKKLNVSSVIVGTSRAKRLVQFIRGNVVTEVQNKLPIEIDLIVIS